MTREIHRASTQSFKGLVMSFLIARFTTTAAVPKTGTFTIPYPLGTNIGSFVGVRSHFAFVQGHGTFVSSGIRTEQNASGVLVNIAPGFSVTAQASNILITWLNDTPIPASTTVTFQLDLVGLDRPIDGPIPVLDAARAIGMYVRLGAPATASATAILATTAVSNANTVTLATPYRMDAARNIAYVSSNAGDTTQTITIKGMDRYDVPMTETVTLNGTTSVPGKKAFFTVISYKSSAALAGNLSLGTGIILGLPVILGRKNFVFREFMDDAVLTTGVFLAADTTTPSAVTGDIRGTYAPASAPNAARVYELLVAVPDAIAQVLQF